MALVSKLAEEFKDDVIKLVDSGKTLVVNDVVIFTHNVAKEAEAFAHLAEGLQQDIVNKVKEEILKVKDTSLHVASDVVEATDKVVEEVDSGLKEADISIKTEETKVESEEPATPAS